MGARPEVLQRTDNLEPEGGYLAERLGAEYDQCFRPVGTAYHCALFQHSEVPVAVGDAARLRALTGWRPRHSFEETVLSVLDEHRRRIAEARGTG